RGRTGTVSVPYRFYDTVLISTGKWEIMNSNCQNFNGIYKRLKRLNRSGENEVDLLNRCTSAFKDESRGRAFTQDGPWGILRQHSKWDPAKPIDPVDLTRHTRAIRK
nr:glutathione S-transferase T3-like [Tanacetum cinerariifolium]